MGGSHLGDEIIEMRLRLIIVRDNKVKIYSYVYKVICWALIAATLWNIFWLLLGILFPL